MSHLYGIIVETVIQLSRCATLIPKLLLDWKVKKLFVVQRENLGPENYWPLVMGWNLSSMSWGWKTEFVPESFGHTYLEFILCKRIEWCWWEMLLICLFRKTIITLNQVLGRKTYCFWLYTSNGISVTQREKKAIE